MKVLVSGSRHFNDYEFVKGKLDEYRISEIIQGEATGVDSLAKRYAEERGIPCRSFPALWGTLGKAAGPIRNAEMLSEGDPDLVIAFKAPDSRGTKDMIEQALKAGVPTVVVNLVS